MVVKFTYRYTIFKFMFTDYLGNDGCNSTSNMFSCLSLLMWLSEKNSDLLTQLQTFKYLENQEQNVTSSCYF